MLGTIAAIFRAGDTEIIGTEVSLRLSEIHTSEAVLTQQPIEDGSVISDHLIIQPDIVEVHAEVANAVGLIEGVLDLFQGDGFNFTLGEKAKTSWARFKSQLKMRELYDLVTFHEIYENMALINISGEHSAPRTGTLSLRLTFQEVNRTRTTVVDVPESQLQSEGDDPVSKSASGEVSGGTVDAPADTENTSLAAQVLDSLET